MRILMLGNSFTTANHMPDMLDELTGAEIVQHTRGGERLADQLNPKTKMGKRTQEALQNEKELLASCYLSSMQLALEHKIRKIAFPSISTGVYSFPVGLAARIAVNTVAGFLKEHPDDFDLVEWVLFDEHTELVYAIEVNAHNKGI